PPVLVSRVAIAGTIFTPTVSRIVLCQAGKMHVLNATLSEIRLVIGAQDDIEIVLHGLGVPEHEALPVHVPRVTHQSASEPVRQRRRANCELRRLQPRAVMPVEGVEVRSLP